MVPGGIKMTSDARIYMNEKIIERVYQDVVNHPEVEIGGRWIGHVYQAGEQPSEGDVKVDDSRMTYVVYDYIPTGPNPQKSTKVELQPDRNYQLWALRKLQSIDENIEVLGSWHSHVPNGLEHYSTTDHRSYYSKLNNDKNPYPFDGLLCSLIHEMPKNSTTTKENLGHAWFAKNSPMGEHSWYESEEINWLNLPQIGAEFVDLEDFSSYLSATGKKSISLDEWIAAITFVAESSGYEDHEIKRSPGGEKILLLERMPDGTDYAVEINQDEEVYFIEKSEHGRERFAIDSVQEAMQNLEHAILDSTGLSANWSHVNKTLARSIANQAKVVQPKRGWLARLLGK
jgi:hypothetical protein